MCPDWLSQLRLAQERPGCRTLRRRGGGASWHREDKGRSSPRGTFLIFLLHTWTRLAGCQTQSPSGEEPSLWEWGGTARGRSCWASCMY